MVIRFIFVFFLIFVTTAFAAENGASLLAANDTTHHKDVLLPTITVEAGRVGTQSPTTFTNLNSDEISHRNTVADLPMVLNTVPGMFSYADAGSPVGYSNLRLRGFDQSKVSVMINGMPLNDPETHMVYWVDLPDIAASAEDIQVQRGAGGSMLGLAPFGGAVNLVTMRNGEPGIQGEYGYGTWNTRKTGFQYSSGLLNNQWSFNGRFSKLNSDGYRNDSWTDLWSAYLSAARVQEHGVDRFNVILGNEHLGLAYYGIPMDSILAGSKYNPLSSPIPQADKFQQNHYQWLTSHDINSDWKYSHTLYLSTGIGSYVEWYPGSDLSYYGIPPIHEFNSTGGDSIVTTGDVADELWVSITQVGWLPRVVYTQPWGSVTGELEVRGNVSDHWGVVDWSSVTPPGGLPQPEYYRWHSSKEFYGGAVSGEYHASDKLLLSAGLSLRHITNIIHQNFSDSTYYPGYSTKADWTFFLPRAGAVYDFGKIGMGRFSVAQSASEPTQAQLFDADYAGTPAFNNHSGMNYTDPIAKPEQLTSFELGFRHHPNDDYLVDVAVYYNLFHNEIIPTGGIDSLGRVRVGNANRSYQFGIELDGGVKLPAGFSLKGNLAYEVAKFSDYTVYDQLADSAGTVKATKLDGNAVPKVPTLLTSGTLAYEYHSIEAWTTTRYVGQIPLNRRGESEFHLPPFGVTGIGLRYTLPEINAMKGVTLQVNARVENLFDRRYAAAGDYDEYATDTGIATENSFYPGAPRNVWFGVGVKM